MKLEELLFYLAVAGDLVLFAYAIRNGYRAFSFFRKKNLENALWSASAACALLGLAMLLPWSFVAREPGTGKFALLICIIFAPLVAAWEPLRKRFRAKDILENYLAVLGVVWLVGLFVFSGNEKTALTRGLFVILIAFLIAAWVWMYERFSGFAIFSTLFGTFLGALSAFAMFDKGLLFSEESLWALGLYIAVIAASLYFGYRTPEERSRLAMEELSRLREHKAKRPSKWEPDDDIDFYHGDAGQYRL